MVKLIVIKSVMVEIDTYETDNYGTGGNVSNKLNYIDNEGP